MPASWMALRTLSKNPGCRNCTAETLTDIWPTWSPWASHAASWAQAQRSAQAPRCLIRPFFSATGMKTSGRMNSPAWSQRISASTAQTSPVAGQTMGW
ncbi:hypothetical protein D3C81_1319200 [compost metagenome]